MALVHPFHSLTYTFIEATTEKPAHEQGELKFVVLSAFATGANLRYLEQHNEALLGPIQETIAPANALELTDDLTTGQSRELTYVHLQIRPRRLDDRNLECEVKVKSESIPWFTRIQTRVSSATVRLKDGDSILCSDLRTHPDQPGGEFERGGLVCQIVVKSLPEKVGDPMPSPLKAR
jgi:hypothetical protein